MKIFTSSLILTLCSLLVTMSKCQQITDQQYSDAASHDYYAIRKGSPDPLFLQSRPPLEDIQKPFLGAALSALKTCPINFPAIEICSNEYRITSASMHIPDISKIIPDFSPQLSSPTVFVLKRPENLANDPLNINLFSLTPKYYPKFELYQVIQECGRTSFQLINPLLTDTTRSYKLDGNHQYLLAVGVSTKYGHISPKSRGNFAVLFTSDLNTLESRFKDIEFQGKDNLRPHFQDEYGMYSARFVPDTTARLLSKDKETELGTFKPTEYCPFFNAEQRSFEFFWVDGDDAGCGTDRKRSFSIVLLPKTKIMDSKNGSSTFPWRCHYRLIFDNAALDDIANKLTCPCNPPAKKTC